MAALKALRGIESKQGDDNGRERVVQTEERKGNTQEVREGSGFDSPISRRLRKLGLQLSEQIKSGQEVLEKGKQQLSRSARRLNLKSSQTNSTDDAGSSRVDEGPQDSSKQPSSTKREEIKPDAQAATSEPISEAQQQEVRDELVKTRGEGALKALRGKEVKSLLHSGSKVAPTTAVTEADAHKAADTITMHWSKDAPSVEFAPTFSSLPKEVQDSIKKDQQSNAKAVFHPDTNSIWVILDKHADQADVEESLYHEGGHWVRW